MAAGLSSIHGQFGRRWSIPEEKAPKRQRKAHGQFENPMNQVQNMAVEETLKGGAAEDGDKPKPGSKLQQALKGGGARSIARRVEEQLLKLAETEPAELVDAVRDRLEHSKLSFKRAVAAAKKASK